MSIQFKRSYEANFVPEVAHLKEGELSINLTDQKLYTLDQNANVINIGFSKDTADNEYVTLVGATMTGELILPGNPVSDLAAATKSYVDSFASSSTTYFLKTGGTISGTTKIKNSAPILNLSSNATKQDRMIEFSTNDSLRWSINSNSTDETGSNVGSNFVISRYSDTGVLIDNPIVIGRSNGTITFASRPTFNGYVPWDSANFTPTLYSALASSPSFTGGVISNGFDAGGANFRARDSTYGAMFRVSGGSAYFLGTDADKELDTYNAFRPLYWNLATGAVTIDGTGVGTTFGGKIISNKGFRAAKGAPGNDTASVGYAFAADGDTGIFAEGGDSDSSSTIVIRDDAVAIASLTSGKAEFSGYVKSAKSVTAALGVPSVANNALLYGFNFGADGDTGLFLSTDSQTLHLMNDAVDVYTATGNVVDFKHMPTVNGSPIFSADQIPDIDTTNFAKLNVSNQFTTATTSTYLSIVNSSATANFRVSTTALLLEHSSNTLADKTVLKHQYDRTTILSGNTDGSLIVGYDGIVLDSGSFDITFKANTGSDVPTFRFIDNTLKIGDNTTSLNGVSRQIQFIDGFADNTTTTDIGARIYYTSTGSTSTTSYPGTLTLQGGKIVLSGSVMYNSTLLDTFIASSATTVATSISSSAVNAVKDTLVASGNYVMWTGTANRVGYTVTTTASAAISTSVTGGDPLNEYYVKCAIWTDALGTSYNTSYVKVYVSPSDVSYVRTWGGSKVEFTITAGVTYCYLTNPKIMWEIYKRNL